MRLIILLFFIGLGAHTSIEWKSKDGSWYALKEFHKTVTENSKPVSNVITNATTAFCVHLMNQSVYKHSNETWKPEFNLV